jgi:serine/threonine-protein kinase RsbW
MDKLFEYQAIIQAIPQIREDLKELANSWGIPVSELRQITLITEELFSNTIRFAFGKGEEAGMIQIRVSLMEKLISLEIIDEGIAFNPLEYDPDPRHDPAAANDGGMGMTLIRTFSDSISYSRKGNRNHLLVHKTIKSIP